MQLTDRQKLTIEHLNYKTKKSPEEIIAYCEIKLTQPQRHNHRKNPHQRVPGRKHAKRFYQEIIEYYQNNAKP